MSKVKTTKVNIEVPEKMVTLLSDFKNGKFSNESLVLLLCPLLQKEKITLDEVAELLGVESWDVVCVLDKNNIDFRAD